MRGVRLAKEAKDAKDPTAKGTKIARDGIPFWTGKGRRGT